MARSNVAKVLADTLLNAGVKRIYGVVGDSLNGVTECLRKQEQIEWIGVRHEEVAAFAAGAEAHLTGELACAREAAVPATCTSSTVFTIATGAASPFWPSRPRFPVGNVGTKAAIAALEEGEDHACDNIAMISRSSREAFARPWSLSFSPSRRRHIGR